jgi:hypothetical protein
MADTPPIATGDEYALYVPTRTISLKALFESGGFDGIPSSAVKTKSVFTSSQEQALDQLGFLAEAYFLGMGRDLPFTPRYNALLIAATGSGKTKITQDLAKKTASEFICISAGEWIVRGAHLEQSTTTALLRSLERSPRTVLLLDELDKFTSPTDSSWVRACAGEIWALLDRRLPIEDFCSKHSGGRELIDLLKDRLANGLYIVGAGTFQSVWELSERQSCGFNPVSSCGVTDEGIMETIKKQNIVSPELLSRFNPKAILLRYPSRCEIPALLEKFGLKKLAADVGIQINPDEINFSGVGLRALEQLGAEFLTARLKRQSFKQMEATDAIFAQPPNSV